MYLLFFLLLFSSGVSSYFLPLKETLHLQKKAKSAIIDEILCLLEAENETSEEKFFIPSHIRDQSCAHDNTENFIEELQHMHKHKCMKTVEEDMKKLRTRCPILQKPSCHNHRCSEGVKKKFLYFIKSLAEFLRWVNEEQDCSNIVRNDLGLYQDGNCSCPKPWKYQKWLL